MCEPRHVEFFQYCRCGCLTIIPIAQRFVDGHGPDVVVGAGDAPPPTRQTRGDNADRGGVPGRLRAAVTGSDQGARSAPHPAQVEATGRPPTGDSS